jgi:phosphoenolpyruvate synthase/pyruvate phosphate dikinase
LANAGFQVPGGFQVTTAAYRRFVADHDLQEQIIELARPAVVEGKASFEQSSTAIGELFSDTGLSAEISAEIEDNNERARIERMTLQMGKRLVTERNQFHSIQEVIELAK